MHWPLIAALALIVLKLAFKLLIFNRPDVIDTMKAIAALPLDVSFLIVTLFFRAAASGGVNDESIALAIMYIISSLLATLLWRVSERALTNTVGLHFIWACPLNFAFAGMILYAAMRFAGVA
jgi:hypothetical protein